MSSYKNKAFKSEAKRKATRNKRIIRKTLDNLGGSSSIVWIVVLLVTFLASFAGDGLYAALEGGIKNATGWHDWAVSAAIGLFSLFIVFWVIAALRSSIAGVDDSEPPIVDNWPSRPVRTLVLSLSLVPGEQTPFGKEALTSFSGAPSAPEDRREQLQWCKTRREHIAKKLVATIGEDYNLAEHELGTIPHFCAASWRMPFEAVRHQLKQSLETLEQVIVVASSDLDIDDPALAKLPISKLAGTHHLLPIFCEALQKALVKAGSSAKVVSIDAVAGIEKEIVFDQGWGRPAKKVNISKGVPFTDLEACVHSYLHLFDALERQLPNGRRLGKDDVLVDATGGLALNSTAAVAFAVLSRDRAFQYVDTNTYEVRSYDVYHDVSLLLR